LLTLVHGDRMMCLLRRMLDSNEFLHYYGDEFRVECPTGSGNMMTLLEVADDLSCRLISIFLPGPDGRRPVFGGGNAAKDDPEWQNNLLFYEYFHGDTGAGIGASHQTGWTALVAKLLDEQANRRTGGAHVKDEERALVFA
jgi:hypothetical protein